jgi:hypothetical protein
MQCYHSDSLLSEQMRNSLVGVVVLVSQLDVKESVQQQHHGKVSTAVGLFCI